MKCDELKPLVFSISDLAYVDEPTPQPNFQNPHDHAVYKATEVDSAIAELKQKLEDVQASAYAESVDAGMRERRLRRALWLARANMARGLAEMCETQIDCCGVSRSRLLVGWDKKSKPKRMTTTEWGKLWRKIEQKCRAKAESYL